MGSERYGMRRGGENPANFFHSDDESRSSCFRSRLNDSKNLLVGAVKLLVVVVTTSSNTAQRT